MTQRLLLNFLFIISIFTFPWWMSVLVGTVLLFRYSAYEVIVGGALMDLLFGFSIAALFDFQFVFTSGFFVLFIVIDQLKRHLIFYDPM